MGNVFKTHIVKVLLCLAPLLPSKAARASDFWDYFSGCMMAMGGGMAGTAFANTKLAEGQKISAQGYAVSGGLGCLTGMAFVGAMGSQAKFQTEYNLQDENTRLMYHFNRLSKERCLLKNTCEPGGKAIIVDSQQEIRKQGDKVFETTTSTIEANE